MPDHSSRNPHGIPADSTGNAPDSALRTSSAEQAVDRSSHGITARSEPPQRHPQPVDTDPAAPAEPWKPVCVLCATRDRKTVLEAGHCCNGCRERINTNLASIVSWGDLTAVVPPTGSTGSGASGYESKPPMNLERVDPYLATVNVGTDDTPVRRRLDDILGQWERLIRTERNLSWYGDATAHHTGADETALAAQAVRQSVAMLRANLDWITTTPTFPLEDFASEIDVCSRRMRALGRDSRNTGDRVVHCPTITEERTPDGEPKVCGQRLTVRTWAALDASESETGRPDWSIGEEVRCTACGATRSPQMLLRAAGKESTYVDPEALARWYGVGKSTIRRWAGKGRVRREGGLYSWADVDALVRHADDVGA